MAKPPVPDDQLRRQFEELLALPDTDPQAALLRDLLGSVLRLNESRLDMLDRKISHRTRRGDALRVPGLQALPGAAQGQHLRLGPHPTGKS